MKLHELHPAPGATRERKRVGRGHGSGHVKTAGRGTKGQKSRSGGNIRPGFEGGQTPIMQQLPYKRGFTNIFRVEYEIVNLNKLEEFPAESTITPETLIERGFVDTGSRVKILGSGELTKPLHVKAHRFSASARSRIEAAGGSVEGIQ
ncbi:MAG: 50S ribosomal protein L15 [Chloroflexi bacterium]|nr:50S ribosomal protein L15 [Chloroflexota bacterium]